MRPAIQIEPAGCTQLTACCPKGLADEHLCTVQLAARVDAESSMNDPSRHPESAYLPVEQQLARLEALSGVEPLCLPANTDLYRQAFCPIKHMHVSGERTLTHAWPRNCACAPTGRCIKEATQSQHQHGTPALYQLLPGL